jgi:membrane-associated phospholipid phosphatase
MQKIKFIVPLTFLLLPLAFFLRSTEFFHKIDVSAAYFFNDLIRFHPSTHNFWAYLNSKMGNWLYDVVMAFFIIPYIIRGGKKEWLERLITSLLIIGFSLFCYLVFNYRVTRGLHYKSLSPSGVLPDFFHLAPLISWTKVKEFSSISYPSDHGSTIFMFIFSTFYLMGKRAGLFATLVSIPFALPRLLVGAHWTSDLFLGSLPLALFNLSWFFYTPIYNALLQNILRVLHGINNFRKKLQKTLQSR